MRTSAWIGIVVLVVLCLALCGCPKPVKQAAEVARTAQDAQDGNYTVKGEKGEEIKVETKGEGESGSVTVTGPDGATKSEFGEQAVKQEDVGIDFYPGATVQGGGKVTGGEKGGSWAAVGLETKDPFDKVASWYKDKYGKGNTVIESPGSLMITLNAGENKGKIIMVAEDKDKGITTIGIHSGEGG
ncbi:MAG: hypothetical protein FJX75_00165 [Armatimonadetes bacterium]|nr:hypothetical protein [Armatimonadota bacterium]